MRDPATTTALLAIVGVLFAWLLWLAWPSLLPPGRGPDLVHHLMLIDYIEQHWHLPHDPNLGAVLGEMVDYTPGVHLLAALGGAWTRSDGLHSVYSIVAFTAALKAGMIFLIAARLLRGGDEAVPFACIAVLLLFLPETYFILSFTDTSYLAQVASEFFAVSMWWAAIAWNDQPTRANGALVGIAGVGTLLAWPVWLGVLLPLFALTVFLREGLTAHDRRVALAIGALPPLAAAAMHAVGRARSVRILAAAGYATLPKFDLFGGWFLGLSAAGLLVALFDRRERTVVWFAVGIALQAAALLVVALATHASYPYQTVKMVFLMIYPLAVAGALALAAAWRFATSTAYRAVLPSPLFRASRLARLSWLLVLVVAFWILKPVIKERRAKPVVTEQLYQAGLWARANLDVRCIDYLVENDYSAYWLHLGVLRNPRADPRTLDTLYEAKKALVRWILPRGRPYAIAENFEGLPKDIRTSVDVVMRFGAAAIVKRRGPTSCD